MRHSRHRWLEIMRDCLGFCTVIYAARQGFVCRTARSPDATPAIPPSPCSCPVFCRGLGNPEIFAKELGHFLGQPLTTWFICLGAAQRPPGEPGDFWATPFWGGDEISATPAAEFALPPDDQAAAAAQGELDRLGRKRVIVHDSHKATMLGWDNTGFFNAAKPWPHVYPELTAGSGNMSLAALLQGPSIGGLITPHDYQARGVGGVFEPEGIADSAVLRGRLMLCEMDTRSWSGTDVIAPARDEREFAAVTWRNIAESLTRGIVPYWMDTHQDWFGPPEIQPTIRRQAEVLREAVVWPHETVPGIAMILDDEAVLETNGDGRFLNEAVMWEWKMGLVRAGVPVRKYLVDDLALPNFPPHKVYFFPNLFRIDADRQRLLEQKVLRGGHVVVWGPGTGISDGETIGSAAAHRATGFDFELLDVNYPRRTLLANTTHPLTRGLSPATVLGGPLSYGPVLFPTTGTPLGIAWTKLGVHRAGLAVAERLGVDGSPWTSVFTTSTGLPAGFWRNAARHAGAHVWCEDDDLVMADAGLVALHAHVGGPKTLHLPESRRVIDVISGQTIAEETIRIDFDIDAPGTAVFRLGKPQ